VNHIFGPVYSRRFGISLGIDLSSKLKQCNFDCLYCELKGAKTVDEQSVVTPVQELKKEIKEALELHKNLDVITITANGEPTLYPWLSSVIEFVNAHKNGAKSLILSNGFSICQKDTFETLMKFDIVKLSLDSALKNSFLKLDRPSGKSVDIESLIECMSKFSRSFSGFFVLEALFVKNINDSNDDIKALKEAFAKINPNRIDIGTIARPPAYNVLPITEDRLLEIAELLKPLPVVVTGASHREEQKKSFSKEDILSLLVKRPLDKEEIALLFDTDSKNRLESLALEEKIVKKDFKGKIFYKTIDK